MTVLFCLIGIAALLFLTAGDSQLRGHFTSIVETEKNHFLKADSAEATAMLQKKVDEMKKKRGPDYKPRTKHLLDDGSAKYTNRLFLESSPYLLQHAHNPVNWYPWGQEAFDAAKKQGIPLFVSIGYSTCHWCHVMEEESFEDEEIAEYINQHFIPVKVDREERPDVDSVYMSAVQLLTGSGGWPLNVWMTPDLIPFFGGTYFPPRDGDRGTATGFLTLLQQINTAYLTKQDMILSSGKQLTQYINQSLSPPAGSGLPDKALIETAVNDYKKLYDPKDGGTKSAPKFPSTINLRLLLRSWKQSKDHETLEIVENTLIKMANGGINDQVGGGFHRYSTDSKWLVPHFEKMLYDNALLAATFTEAFQATGKERYKTEARKILDYVKNEMTSETGGFYSATDADTLTDKGEKEEGFFFTWTEPELKAALNENDFRIAKRYYSIGSAPHFEGRYIPHITEPPSIIASEYGLTEAELEAVINKIRGILYKYRQQKAPPFTDTKILASWNALMITAFAKAGLIFDDEEYANIAEKAGDFILKNLVKEDILYRSYKDDMAKYIAYLEDYSYLVAALTDLYEVTGKTKWLEKAIAFDKSMVNLFEDEIDGGFYTTSAKHQALPAREKPVYDGATPSGNAIAVLNLLRLYSYTTDAKYLNTAEKALTCFSDRIKQNPTATGEMLIALDYYYDKPKEIIIVTPKGEKASADAFLKVFRESFTPNRILSVVSQGDELTRLEKSVPLVKGKLAVNKKTTVFICEKGVCRLPVSSPAEFNTQLQN